MNLRVIGLNHRSAMIEVRERLAFSPSQIIAALSVWQDTTSEFEAVLLSTCNRTEFYVASESDSLPSNERLLKFLLDQKEHTADGGALASQIFTFDDVEAVEHLFSVTSSLDSMVLGEVQIPAQVKEAYQLALESETVGPLTHGLFQAALKTAKEVATNTDLHRHRVSIPSVAITDFALQIFERLDDKRIFVIGAGEMGRETLLYLVEHGAKRITVTNRNSERAGNLAAEFGAEFRANAVNWDERFEAMVHADIIISTTGAPDPVVTREHFRPVAAQRQGQTLFILDLAVPRDFESGIDQEPGVFLYTLDDLQKICDKNRLERSRDLPKAMKIVAKSAREFVQNMNHRHGGELIRELRDLWTKTKDSELHRLFNKLPELKEQDRAEIEYAFERLMGKFLHPPMESLRDESRNGVPHALLEALARLFRLNNR